ncbi:MULTISPECIES: DNA helicase Rep [unclassified Oleiphilus]|nr:MULTISPECIES: DNA helicase Rep [unclassified Oleiphilus]KZY30684.1 ATP-dependent DNA helicase Rep [Oleiphilus sp. HI0043]KZY56105.1 ATP-dependent DNA helicase Rep [Oleiphilus sp. HI0061]KZY77693.1 ATP-dependent DNA helicase Rep [Oleiphilus sp. HI0069]KZZ64132.1 ATP-dependent DNA helicase Rep [Oleiphilus sp. HI0128]
MANKLNPKQQEAVDYVGGPLLVLAGAGSGKTSVITRKIAYLIKSCGIPGRHIAAVTFTNKASREMKERVGQLVSGPDARGLTVSTFHNLGLNIIRTEHKALGYKPGFSIFDSEDAKALIRDLMMKDGEENSDRINEFQMAISNWKNAMLTPAQAAQQAQTPDDVTLAHVYETYTRYLKAYNALDFDDLILLPVQLFAEHPDILSKWRQKIRYLLVDEYQDTNMAQYELVKQIVGDRHALTVVGDDDQSIYAWRGARPENLARLEKDFPSLKLIKLEQNYRSTSLILRAANTLIANNPHMFDKALWSQLGDGERIRVIRCRHEDAEAEQIAAEILDLKLKKDIPFKDFAVLYRGNHQARLLEIKMQAFQVPYRLSGGTSFFAKNEIKDAMAYLRLIANPDDDAAFLRVVNVPRREIGPSTLEKLGNYSTERHISLNQAVGEIGLEQVLSGKALDRVRRFSDWLRKTTERCYQEDPIPVIKQLFTDIEYDQWLYQNSNTPKAAEKRMENIWYLVDSLKNMIDADKGTADEIGIEEAVSKLILRDMLEQQEEEDDSDKVHMLTLHASKGLEFPHVFIMGLEEELLPHRNSIEEDNIEEERRLMYVGITRAQRTLALTYAAARKQYGEKIETIPSRFLDEIPEDDLQWEGGEQKDKELVQKKGNQTLSALLDGLK